VVSDNAHRTCTLSGDAGRWRVRRAAGSGKQRRDYRDLLGQLPTAALSACLALTSMNRKPGLYANILAKQERIKAGSWRAYA
jgi:hypothetical protein